MKTENAAQDMTGKKISLVLGSGGARGLCHIGIIRCLEERGYDIRYISGSSIGALIGGIYAVGKLDAYADWVCDLQKIDLLKLLDWSFSRGAIFRGNRIIEELKELTGDHDIDDLDIGFTAVATDLYNEREVWFNSGPLYDAVRASIAVPMVFEPVYRDGRILVDGGLVNPIPIAPTLNNLTDLTIAVDLNAPMEKHTLPEDHQEVARERSSVGGYGKRITDFISGLLPYNQEEDDDDDMPGAFDLVMRSMDAMQTTIARFKLAAYRPGQLINIPRNLCDFFEFYRARELIEFGYRRTGEILDEMKDDDKGSA